MSLGRTAKTVVRILVVIVLTAMCLVATGCDGTKGLTSPSPVVGAVLAEPDYTVTLEWNSIKQAESYVVEYEYGLYPEDIHSVATGSTSVTVRRVKGTLRFRAKSVSSTGESDFSEWCEYDVPELELDALRTFNVKLENGKYYIDADTFEPVTYVYKGERKTVNYYEFDLVPPDTESDTRNPMAYSLTQIREGFAFNIGDISGVWKLYARPALYVDINGEKDYSQVRELNELYKSEIRYIIVEITV